MDNVTLKTLKFPGLDNTYVVPQDATEFSTSTAYAVGDYVIYEGVLYRFTSAHAAGAWTGSDAVATKTTDELAAQSSRIATLDNTKAAKTALASTDREVTLLRKAIEGQLMEVEEDHTEAYSKTLPSGTIGVGVNMIGGKSVVFNQLVQNGNFADKSIWQRKGGMTLTVSNNICTINCIRTGSADNQIFVPQNFVVGHKYYMQAELKVNDASLFSHLLIETWNNGSIEFTKQADAFEKKGKIITATKTSGYVGVQGLTTSVNNGGVIYAKNIMLIDLTQLYGAGNEPETVDEFRAMFHEDYYEYNAGEIISADCEGAVSEGKNMIDETNFVHQTGSSASVGKEGDTYYTDNDTAATWVNPVKLKPNTTYVYSAYIKASDLTKAQRYSVHIAKDKFIGTYLTDTIEKAKLIPDSTTEFTRKSVTFTTDSEHLYLFNFVIAQGGKFYFKEPQLEEASTITPYSQHMSDSLSFPQGLLEDYPLRSAGTAYDSLTFTKPSPTAAWKAEHHGKMNAANPSTFNWVDRTSVYPGVFSSLSLTDYLYNTNVQALMGNYQYYGTTVAISNFSSMAADKSFALVYDPNDPTPVIYIKDSSVSSVAALKEKISSDTIIYEKATETVTDVTSYFPEGFSPLLEAEAGGSITFKQTGTEFPLPNSTDYFVKTTPTVA